MHDNCNGLEKPMASKYQCSTTIMNINLFHLKVSLHEIFQKCTPAYRFLPCSSSGRKRLEQVEGEQKHQFNDKLWSTNISIIIALYLFHFSQALWSTYSAENTLTEHNIGAQRDVPLGKKHIGIHFPLKNAPQGKLFVNRPRW